MCILMYFGPGAMPIREHLDNGCTNNPDGFGWAIVTVDRGILVGHSMTSEEAVEGFIAARTANPEQTAIFHARITTDGTTSLDNCHPFYVNDRRDMVLAHNGILPCSPTKGDLRSDTRILAEEVFAERFADLDNREGPNAYGMTNRDRFETWMGQSKVVVLTTAWDEFEYQSYLFNEQLGFWLTEKDGCPEGQNIWYSNTSHCKRTYTYGAGFTYNGVRYGYGLNNDGWPTVIGGKSSYTESWDSEAGVAKSSYSGYVLACVECGFEVDECLCGDGQVRRYMPEWQVKAPRELETDWSKPETWVCVGCKLTNTVDADTLKCQACDTMFCCDEDEDVCQCPHRMEEFLKPSRSETLALPAGPSAVEFIDSVVTDLS